MKPTTVRLLVALAVLAAAVGWGAVSLMQGQSGRILPVPWLAASTMWILAVALAIWTFLARPRLRHRPGAKPMQPILAARTAALAMAGSRTGALVTGFYSGVGLAALPSRFTMAGQETLWAAAGTAIGSLLLVVVALWLEHICRLPLDRDGGDGANGANGAQIGSGP